MKEIEFYFWYGLGWEEAEDDYPLASRKRLGITVDEYSAYCAGWEDYHESVR